jgi:2-haloacid dehalogenase
MFGGSIVGVVNILEEIKDLGYPLAALSNWSAEMFPITYNSFEFLSWFDPLIISGEVGLAKPDPDIFYVLLQRLNRDPGECIFIDDTIENIEVAREIGFESIHFTTPEKLRTRLEDLQILKDGKA